MLRRKEPCLKRRVKWSVVASCMFGLVLAGGLTETYGGDETPTLSDSDCIKCHAEAPRDVEERGGAHKTAVTCVECHEGHPPVNMEIIPQCSNCHSGESHFDLEGCLGCHSNPHAPLDLKLTKNMTDPCLTCHSEQKPQLDQFQSFHSTMDCTACHNKHALIPECMSCHEGHSAEMVQADCNKCHQAHQPLMVAYAEDLDSRQCASCHDDAFDLLMASSTKHRDVSCVTCHQETHKMVPQCQDCHGVPHPDGIIAKFPKCGDCHSIAHDLNR